MGFGHELRSRALDHWIVRPQAGVRAPHYHGVGLHFALELGLRPLLDTVDGTDHYTSLARVEVPTLHVAGQYDDIAPVEQAQEARDAMATGLAQVQVLEGTGHSPQLQRPQAFADAVGAFLTGRVRP